MAKTDQEKKAAEQAARNSLGLESKGDEKQDEKQDDKPKAKDLTEGELNDALMSKTDSGGSNSVAEASEIERKNEIGNLAELVDGKILGLVQRDSGMLGLRVKTFLDQEFVVWFAAAPFDEAPGFAAVEAK